MMRARRTRRSGGAEEVSSKVVRTTASTRPRTLLPKSLILLLVLLSLAATALYFGGRATAPPRPPLITEHKSPPTLRSVIDAAARLHETHPHEAVRLLQSQPTPNSLPDAIVLADARADAFSAAHLHADAAAQRRVALSARHSSGAHSESHYKAVIANVALAEDLRALQDYEGALAAADDATAAAAVGGKDGDLAAVILRLRASLLDCAGDAASALKAFNSARRMASSAPDVAEILQLLQLLRRALSGGGLPPEVDTMLREQRSQLTSALLARGPWTHSQQLPKTFVPGLASQPWHSVQDNFPSLTPVEAALKAATASLREEVLHMAANGLLSPETECIHSGGGAAWRTYMVNGAWQPRRDADGCSEDTPAACALLAAVKRVGPPGFRVLRGGYSLIDAAAHLHPHCGITNAQLKFHLGLIVPRDEQGGACAQMRVGNETRAWEEGGVLFFDDSWDHEVWNRCNATRAVFQLVFAHPELNPRYDPFPKRAATH